jgi:PEP-CTERM motif-containing protein
MSAKDEANNRIPASNPRKRRLIAAVATALVTLAAPAASAPVYFDTGIHIAIPALSGVNLNPGGAFTSYDIMWVDNGLVYLADRSNATVDVISAATNTWVTRIGSFVGQNPPPPAAPVTAQSGPDGLVVANTAAAGHTLYAGDGNSTLKAFNLNAGNAQIANVSTDAASTANPPTFAPAKRVDEMAFSPVNNTLLVANNAASPAPFTTLINATTNTIVPGSKVAFTTAGGIEQSVFDPVTGKFYLNIDDNVGPGSVAVINPTTGLVEKTYSLGAIPGGPGPSGVCGPSGLAVDQGGKLMVGCGAGPSTFLLDPAANGGVGSLKAIPLTGEDMVWFDPVRKLFFLTARNFPDGCNPAVAPPTANACTPELGIVDDLGNLLQTLPTSFAAHSIAVDPVTGKAFMPYGGVGPGGAASSALTVCPLGCVEVFALIPEPGSLALLGTGLALVGGFGWRRRRSLGVFGQPA